LKNLNIVSEEVMSWER